jgi:demethylmenaquinone methyltransferase/2-methoxy-6-polyprenyl-1,4-benzoquinol methylase
MFDAVAPRYDLLNRILSLGMDVGWRRRAVRAMALGEGDRMLDVAAGTADLALEVVRLRSGCSVVASDPALRMLGIGRRKVAQEGLDARMRLCGADVLRLPFPDGAFAASGIAFGIRNVPDRRAGLAEMARVVRPGGRVVVLELVRPQGSLLAPLARFYVRWVVPLVGGVVSSRVAYRYLKQSMEGFPPPDRFRRTMEEAGLRVLEARPLFPGACHLFVGEAPERSG